MRNIAGTTRHRPMSRAMRHAMSLSIGVLAIALLGCGEETEITAYDAPKEPSGTRDVPPFVQIAIDGGSGLAADPMDRSNQPVPAGPTVRATWVLPEGWSAIEPAPPPSAYAFAVPIDAAAEPLTASVTALPGTGGGLMANLNRWRGQLGLPPVNQPEQQPMTLIEMSHAAPSGDNPTQAPGMVQAIFTDMVSADGDRRRIAAIWPDPTRNTTWFFTIVGDAQPVARATPAFQAFVASTLPDDPIASASPDQTHDHGSGSGDASPPTRY